MSKTCQVWTIRAITNTHWRCHKHPQSHHPRLSFIAWPSIWLFCPEQSQVCNSCRYLISQWYPEALSHLQSESIYTSTHPIAIAQPSDTNNNTLEKIPLLFCCCTQLNMKSAFYIFSKQRHRTKLNFTFASSNCLPVVLDVKLQPPIKSMTKTSEFATLNPKPLPST